ncbi:hypothetical protein [Streptomyces sp. 8N616]|uniref:hypothetical protein n=1 Tax=Streptomyces sp. 8N616 TaxID=3457414 RepID=UPI003FD20B76
MRNLYTGEPHQLALEALRHADNRIPIPQASTQQAYLESQILAHLNSGGWWWAHPLGISAIRPSDRWPVVLLDSHTELSGGAAHPMSDFAIVQLLPYAEPGIQVHAIPGVRVAATRGADLHLAMIGTDARVILRATKGTNWRQELSERRESLLDGKLHPLWEEPGLTHYEREHEAEAPLTMRAERNLAWLGSGLFRRIALFHTSSSAYSTRSWIQSDEWRIELDTATGVSLDHNGFLARLCDRSWGIPLKIERHNCTCHLQFPPNRPLSRQCTYYLAHTHDDSGELQIRFRSERAFEDDGVRATLESVGAEQSWLNRVLPATEASEDAEASR